MPSSPNYKRNYKEEYERSQGTPKQLKAQAERHKGRREYEKKNGVDHKKPRSKGGKTKLSNLRAVPKGENRSFARTKTGKLKSQTSRRERAK